MFGLDEGLDSDNRIGFLVQLHVCVIRVFLLRDSKCGLCLLGYLIKLVDHF